MNEYHIVDRKAIFSIREHLGKLIDLFIEKDYPIPETMYCLLQMVRILELDNAVRLSDEQKKAAFEEAERMFLVFVNCRYRAGSEVSYIE